MEEVARYRPSMCGSLDTDVFLKILQLEYLVFEKKQSAENWYFVSLEGDTRGGARLCSPMSGSHGIEVFRKF